MIRRLGFYPLEEYLQLYPDAPREAFAPIRPTTRPADQQDGSFCLVLGRTLTTQAGSSSSADRAHRPGPKMLLRRPPPNASSLVPLGPAKPPDRASFALPVQQYTTLID